jgi:hypothetical protein
MEGSERRYVDNTIQVPSAGLTIRQQEPKNRDAPFDRIDSYLTPTELFYIRSHFPIPALDRASYQLRIDGAVNLGRLFTPIRSERVGFTSFEFKKGEIRSLGLDPR